MPIDVSTLGFPSGTFLAQAPEPVGLVESISGSVTIIRADGTQISANSGLDIFQGDKLITDDGSSIGVVFADDSIFALGGSGEMVIDEMVYDGAADAGSQSLSIATGVFSYISGQIAKAEPDAATLTTPVATIGIRGTSLKGKAAPQGESNTLTLVPDPDGGVGEVTFSNEGGSRIMNQAFQTTQASSLTLPPSIPIVLPKAVVDRVYSQVTQAIQSLAPAQGQAEGDATAGDEQEAGDETPEGEDEAAEDAAAEAFEKALTEGGSLDQALEAAVGAATRVAIAEETGITVGEGGEVVISNFETLNNLLNTLDIAGPLAGGSLLGGPENDDLLGGDAIDLLDTAGSLLPEEFLQAILGTAEEIEAQIVDTIDEQLRTLYETTLPTRYHYVASAGSTATLSADYQDIVVGTTGVDEVSISGQAIAGNADAYTGQGSNDTVILTYEGANTFGFANVASTSNTLNLSATGAYTQSIAYTTAGTINFLLPTTTRGYYQIAGTTDDGSAADQTFTFDKALDQATSGSNSTKITGSTGTDTVTLAVGTNYLSVVGVETVNHASSGTNTVTYETSMSSVTLVGGSGTDTATLTGTNSVTISAIETLTGGSGSDAITVTDTVAATIDTGAGTDSVTLSSNGANTVTISNAETITGGTGVDTITIGASQLASVSAGAGDDKLTGNSGSDVLYGQGGNDTFYYTARSSASIDTTDFNNNTDNDVFLFDSMPFGGIVAVTALNVANGGAVSADANNLLILTDTVTDQNSSGSVDHTDILTVLNSLDYTSTSKNVSRFVVFKDNDDSGVYVGHLQASGGNYTDLDIIAKTSEDVVTDIAAADITFVAMG